MPTGLVEATIVGWSSMSPSRAPDVISWSALGSPGQTSLAGQPKVIVDGLAMLESTPAPRPLVTGKELLCLESGSSMAPYALRPG